ncbi:3-hydroxyisobutyrate mitochondrial precursor, putative [Bodo saltans]|uniref:3-hydroxyisobutyrate dehydrogenase n=1 Tax=Bodo saltans TaxID=75058 RepID=A0A0S4IU65_BODSA|nr:3-hydroxyisobutyrate mitochondrial precursor, putative [Bodo saltans]|eukprot:CUF93097.1 3-hydroxyisobutyrate mitochondrial precursor, putative [Bodo saltans]
MLRASQFRREAFGFIGLGQMGARMAPNIFKDASIDELIVYDVAPDAAKTVISNPLSQGKKITVATSPADVVKHSKKVLTMLPNGKIVSDVYKTHLIPNTQAKTIFIDSSTIDTQTPKDLAAVLRSKDALFFDAPVSGGVNAAAAGILTFMVGAPTAEQFQIAEAILKNFAKSVVHCGDIGSGQVAKLCNNLILGQVVQQPHPWSAHGRRVEAMLMGTRLGVDPKTLAGIFNTSTGRCWSSDTYNPFPGVLPNIPSANEYKGGFGSSLMLKDLGLALDAAKSVNLSAKGAQTAHDVYTSMVKDSNMGSLDFSGVLKHLDTTSPKK